MSTDVGGRVTYLNVVAERMTGWSRGEAAGHPFEEVFHIVDGTTREAIQNPMALAIREDKTVGLTPNCLLMRRDGAEAAIEDSAAPIHDRRGLVTGAVMVFHDVSTARALALRISYLAQHDNLTDLPNRALLNDRLAQAIAVAHRHRRKLAVLFVDVDRFKHINDSLGHVIGDRLLQSCPSGCSIACAVRHRQPARGDEFVVLLPGMDTTRGCGRQCRQNLAAMSTPHRIGQRDDPPHRQHRRSVVYPDDGTDAETLVRNADVAMYRAKNSGRDNYQFFKPDMNVRAVERQSVEDGLRDAWSEHEFMLHYQPKMDLETGRDHRRRGAHPLASPAPRTRVSGAIHPDRRRVRLHRADRPVGAARSVPPGQILAGLPACGRSASRSTSRGGAARQRVRCRRERHPQETRPRPALSGARADRNAPDAGPEVHDRRPPGPQGHGRAARARRLRNRLFELELSEAVSDRHLENRQSFVRDLTTMPTTPYRHAPLSTWGRALAWG